MSPLVAFALVLVLGALLRMLLVGRHPHPERRTVFGALVGRAVERRLGGYRQRLDEGGEGLPERLEAKRSVLVVGSGVAGLSAATTLAERGFAVTLRERNDYLGGKIGAWRERSVDGAELEVEHGFHAFFRHYYNLDEVLGRVGVRRSFQAIDNYLIVTRGRERLSFDDRVRTPLLNLVDLWSKGLFRMSDIVLTRARDELGVFLEYDPEKTFATYDRTSYDAFAAGAELPPKLRVVFNTFSRAFFSEGDRLSVAELMKSFHFYYLSNDAGLLYDYPVDDYQSSILGPWRSYLEARGVTIELGRAVGAIGPRDAGFDVDGERFDAVVLATDVAGTRRLVESSPELAERHPELARSLAGVRWSQRYAVWRVWLDRTVRDDVPVFVNTERETLLDSVSMYHRITPSARAWADERQGAVVELHSYAVPDRLEHEAAVKAALRGELDRYFPELEGARVVHEAFQLKDDFTAFHRGLHASRPTTETTVPGLVLAGDWVRLPCPAMLMEAAATSGLLAANCLLAREGLRPEPVYTVPRRGLLPFRERARPEESPAPKGSVAALESAS
jgi:isorenieratene synthase